MPKYKVVIELNAFEALNATSAKRIASDILRFGYEQMIENASSKKEESNLTEASLSVGYQAVLCDCGCNNSTIKVNK